MTLNTPTTELLYSPPRFAGPIAAPQHPDSDVPRSLRAGIWTLTTSHLNDTSNTLSRVAKQAEGGADITDSKERTYNKTL